VELESDPGFRNIVGQESQLACAVQRAYVCSQAMPVLGLWERTETASHPPSVRR
jgi:hypothetical protein